MLFGWRHGHAEVMRWPAAAGAALLEQAIDAQRNPVQRFQIEQNGPRLATFLVLGMVMLFAPAARAADAGAAVSGVVKDAQGVVQMGALVQVLTANATTVATAFTDSHGRYIISNLNPGKYLVRASATLFVPATRANLQLQRGAVTVVNLTLSALFDTASWLPAERRRAGEPDDDWKWTLRSTANRPILRIVEDGSVIEVSSSASEDRPAVKTRARATVASGDGEFGAGGVHNILAIHRAMDDGGDMIVRADVGSTRVPAAYGPSQEFDAGYEERQGFNGAARTVVSYQAHPEMVGADANGLPAAGLQAMSMTSARRLSLGELLEVEVGGQMQVVSTSRMGMATHPFVRLTTHPMGVWTLHYRMATDRLVQGFEDVTTGQTNVPVALVRNGKLALESGRHQEAAIDRKAGRATISAAYYHDAMGNVSVSGGGAAGPGETAPFAAPGQSQPSLIPMGMVIDPTTGSFRALAAGYTSNGARFTVSAPLVDGLWVAAEYSTGDAIASETGGQTLFPVALAAMRAQTAQAGTVALKGKLKGSNTRIRASYRLQPTRFVTAVDPYSSFSDQAFFSCQLRQPIRWGARLPSGLEATIDVTNLLAQGYRPFLSADGQTLYFAQAPRTVQGGLSFTF